MACILKHQGFNSDVSVQQTRMSIFVKVKIFYCGVWLLCHPISLKLDFGGHTSGQTVVYTHQARINSTHPLAIVCPSQRGGRGADGDQCVASLPPPPPTHTHTHTPLAIFLQTQRRGLSHDGRVKSTFLKEVCRFLLQHHTKYLPAAPFGVVL